MPACSESEARDVDFGLYVRRRLRIWGWLLLPAVVLLALHTGFCFYYGRVVRDIARRRAVLDVLPEMNAKRGLARQRLGVLSRIEGTLPEALDTLTREINDAAAAHALGIVSLSVTEKGGSGPVTSFEARVKGKGSLPALAGFFNAFQDPARLVVVDSLELTGSEFTGTPTYYAQAVLRFGFVTD